MDKVTESWVNRSNVDKDKYNDYIDKLKSMLDDCKLDDITVGLIKDRESDIEVISDNVYNLQCKLNDVQESYSRMLEYRVMHELEGDNEFTLRTYMKTCPICGNKRCPKTENFKFKCTGSNEPDQVGVYENRLEYLVDMINKKLKYYDDSITISELSISEEQNIEDYISSIDEVKEWFISGSKSYEYYIKDDELLKLDIKDLSLYFVEADFAERYITGAILEYNDEIIYLSYSFV